MLIDVCIHNTTLFTCEEVGCIYDRNKRILWWLNKRIDYQWIKIGRVVN